jgi:hypothetical protein
MVPIAAGSKAPAKPWKVFQERLATNEEVAEWVKQYAGLGVVCGPVSGNLEVLDLEAAAPLKEFNQIVEQRMPGLIARMPRVRTPTGGRHLLYRCAVIEGNQKLAADAKGKTLIETRGTGGQVLSPLCRPETHPSGKPYELLAGDYTSIPTIRAEEREILLSSARSFNQYIEPQKARGIREGTQGNGTKPGEDFNNRPDVLTQVQSLLREHGWSKFGNGHAGELWSRPGVDDHSSATLYDNGCLYVFSSNALPFCAGEAYSPFAIHAELKHSGDFSAAAKGLAALGFGHSNGTSPIHNHEPATSKQIRARGFTFTTLDDLLAEPAEQVAYVWDRTLPRGGFSIVAAKPKVGKSTVARALAVAISRGLPFLGRSTTQGKVIYLCLEEKRAEVAQHFRRMGAIGENIIVHTGATPADAIAALSIAVKEHSPVLIIIDPLSRFVRVTDFNAYAEVTRELEPLIDLARLSECQAHILCCHHNGKGGDMRDGGDAVMGSTGFFAAVDSLLTMRKRERARTIESTQRYGEDLPETIVHLDPESGSIEASGNMEEFTLNERKKAVLDALGTEPIAEAGIKELVGGTNGGLTSKAVRALFDEGKLSRIGKGKKGDPFLYSRRQSEVIYFPPACSDEEIERISAEAFG